MNKKRFLKEDKLRASAGRLLKGSAAMFIALMFVAVPTAAHAEGLGDYMPTGPDFAALGPLAPIVVGFFAIVLALVGVLGMVAAAVAAVNFSFGAVTNNERKTASAIDQLKKSGIAILISLAGAVLMVVALNLIVSFVGIF